MACVILVTSSHITSLLRHTATAQTRVQWTVQTSQVINLPVLEEDNLIIHVDKVPDSSKTLTLLKFFSIYRAAPVLSVILS